MTSAPSENESNPIQYGAYFWIPISTSGLLLLIPVLILQAVVKREIRSRNARITKWLILGVFASNGTYQSIFALKWLVCGYCKVILGSLSCSKAIVKAFNLLFLIHRAKLVQGMNPILSKKWFEKIFPTIVVVIISGFIFSIIKNIANRDFGCTNFEDWSDGHTCTSDRNSDGEKGIGGAALALDTLITIFLMVLFIVPLYRVYAADIGQMNHRQHRQRRKLRDLLIWSVVMTFINQVTSTFLLIFKMHMSGTTFILFLISLFDPAINAWTAWLMVTNNRQYLQKSCCSMCRKRTEGKELRRRMSMSNLTNVPSRSATITSVKMSQVPADIASVEMKVSEGDLAAQILPTGTKS